MGTLMTQIKCFIVLVREYYLVLNFVCFGFYCFRGSYPFGMLRRRNVQLIISVKIPLICQIRVSVFINLEQITKSNSRTVMKKFLILILLYCGFVFQNVYAQNPSNASAGLGDLLEKYYKERMQLLPLESTFNGEPGNNDKLYPDFTDSYRQKLKGFFSGYLSDVQKFDRSKLNAHDQLSYDIFKREMALALDGIDIGFFEGWYQQHRFIPFNQFASIPNVMGQLGNGEGAQNFKTTKDYKDWQKRVAAFSVWADSAIIYFRKGITAGIILPEALVVKMIPQLESMVITDVTQSLFYGPIKKLPANFTDAEKKMVTGDYEKMIREELMPTYQKLAQFLKTEYLPKARKSSGIGALPNGVNFYNFLIRYWTTTDNKPEDIYQTGISEVARIRGLMDSVRKAVGFAGDLNAFFDHMKTDKQFLPFKTPEEVLNGYRAIEARITPNLKRMFNNVPTTKFEVRQTEAFRAASASAEYFPGLPDGSRPGIFYVPIINATKYKTPGMEGLFLHEAIPGHHYQFSLQNENKKLPTFRRFFSPGAYVEGWGLYSESLGKELGLFTDPYQYVGALGKEIHRAIRLVVDVGLHEKGWTREQAIKYMMENEPLDERGTIAEIERYMAVPAQALSYKTGSIKLQELRRKYERQLGNKFNLAAFHDAVLGDGPMALETLERKLDVWAEKQAR